jgi:hypothetical protein
MKTKTFFILCFLLGMGTNQLFSQNKITQTNILISLPIHMFHGTMNSKVTREPII